MTPKAFDQACRALPAVTMDHPWGDDEVYKVGGRMFAVTGPSGGLSIKVSDIAFEMLKDRRGLRPAPYLASRGLKWIQHFGKSGLSDAALRDYIRQSHAIVAQGLSKKRRVALGLDAPGTRRGG